MRTRVLPLFSIFAFACIVFIHSTSAFAKTATETTAASGGHGVGKTFLYIAIILAVAAIARLIEKKRQPAVLGELLAGIVLGNLVLFGINAIEPMKHDALISFLAQLGVGILLFQIGLESSVAKLRMVGSRAFIVATVGVVTPFILGYYGSLLLIHDITPAAAIFIGATLTATSVGITARVLRDLRKHQTKEAQIILGAAVIDDVMGLVILAVMPAIVTTGSVSIGTIITTSLTALGFLGGAIIIGMFAAPILSRFFVAIHTGHAMKLITALLFFFVFAYAAEVVGLAPIVGAFAAGLILEAVHFRGFRDPDLVENVQQLHETLEEALDPSMRKRINARFGLFDKIQHARDRHVEELVEPLSYVFTPIFFVTTGMFVDLSVLADTSILGIAIALSLIAITGKLVCGFVAGKDINRWVVGVGMVPRGEVGLIFANVGLALGVIGSEIFSTIVIVVMITTLATPPILAVLLRSD